MNLIFNRVGIIAIIRNSIKNSLTIIRKLYKVVKQLRDAFLWLFLYLTRLPMAGFMAGRWWISWCWTRSSMHFWSSPSRPTTCRRLWRPLNSGCVGRLWAGLGRGMRAEPGSPHTGQGVCGSALQRFVFHLQHLPGGINVISFPCAQTGSALHGLCPLILPGPPRLHLWNGDLDRHYWAPSSSAPEGSTVPSKAPPGGRGYFCCGVGWSVWQFPRGYSLWLKFCAYFSRE